MTTRIPHARARLGAFLDELDHFTPGELEELLGRVVDEWNKPEPRSRWFRRRRRRRIDPRALLAIMQGELVAMDRERRGHHRRPLK